MLLDTEERMGLKTWLLRFIIGFTIRSVRVTKTNFLLIHVWFIYTDSTVLFTSIYQSGFRNAGKHTVMTDAQGTICGRRSVIFNGGRGLQFRLYTSVVKRARRWSKGAEGISSPSPTSYAMVRKLFPINNQSRVVGWIRWKIPTIRRQIDYKLICRIFSSSYENRFIPVAVVQQCPRGHAHRGLSHVVFPCCTWFLFFHRDKLSWRYRLDIHVSGDWKRYEGRRWNKTVVRDGPLYKPGGGPKKLFLRRVFFLGMVVRRYCFSTGIFLGNCYQLRGFLVRP